MTQKISLIIPVYNEEDSIRPLHETIVQALVGMDFEAIYINDGSEDKSGEILDELAKSDPKVKIIHFVRNYGQTAALTAGIRKSESEILVTLDADGQNDPADIPEMIKKLDECDVVCGWRKNRKDNFFTRTLPSRIANWLISRLSNVPLHDYGCTLRVYKRQYIKDIPLYGEMHRFIPIYVTWAGAKIIEVPVRHHPRKLGKSKYGLWRIPKVLLDLTTLKFLRDFFVTPIYFFGFVGLSVIFIGLVLSILAAIMHMNGSDPQMSMALTIMGPLMMILGVIEITLGVIAEVLIRMHYELQNKEPYRIDKTINMSGD